MRHPRLLFYAVNGLGLGHVTRLLGLARQVRRQCPDAEILFLTASEASHVIYREGFAALKVPSRAAATAGRLRRGSVLRLNQSVVWSAVAAFDPHCLVVDTFAAGTVQELLPLLRWPLRKVFVFRVQRPERARDPFLQNTLRLYDLILVPHAAGSETVPTPLEVETLWTGPMLAHEPDEMLDREVARAALGLPPEGFIGLVTLGGGGEPETEAARAALQRATAQAVVPEGAAPLWVEVEGPLSPRTAPTASMWRVLRDVHPLLLYLNAFDGAVAAVGYNTAHELQAAQLPAILWPFPREVDDQAERARRLAAAGRALVVGEGLGANNQRVAELAGAIGNLLQPATRERLRAAMSSAVAPDAPNGAAVGAEAILKLLNHE